MNTIDFATKKLTSLGWDVQEMEYNKPSSGFKCVEGGYFCKVKTNDDDYDQLKEIHYDDNVFGSIHGTGEIMALHKKDFISLINKIPKRQSNEKL